MAGNKFEAIRNFESAVLLAARGGYQQDAALASEHLGMLHLDMQENETAAHQLKEAIKYYQHYGATAKVMQLEGRYSHLWAKKPTEIFTISSDQI